jgi:hypothetical protein
LKLPQPHFPDLLLDRIDIHVEALAAKYRGAQQRRAGGVVTSLLEFARGEHALRSRSIISGQRPDRGSKWRVIKGRPFEPSGLIKNSHGRI